MTLKLALLFLLISSAHAAQKHLYVMGAGGEQKGETTNFDQDISLIGKFSGASNWNSTVSINGGHAKTEKLIKSSFSRSKNLGEFSSSNYEKMLSDIEIKIRDKKIAKGEQLLIMIDSHGAMAKPGEMSHSVSLTDSAIKNPDTLKDSSTVSLDRLKKIANLASENGIKLAIIDDSCHSGNSLKLGNADTCVISSTGDKHYGFGSVDKNNLTFGGRFYKEMKNGKNLEELFLNARTGEDPDFPMISTENGKDIQKMLYDLITPYLYYDELGSRKFIDQYFSEERLKKMDIVICQKDQQLGQLINVLNSAGQNKALISQMDIFSNLKKKLKEYRSYQRDYEMSVASMVPLYAEARSKMSKKYPDQLPKSDFDLDSFLVTNFDFLIEKKDSLGFSKEKVDFFISQKKMKEDIFSGFRPEITAALEKRKNFMKNMFKHSNASRTLAGEISLESKRIYKMLYENNMDKKKSNPCRDFVL